MGAEMFGPNPRQAGNLKSSHVIQISTSWSLNEASAMRTETEVSSRAILHSQARRQDLVLPSKCFPLCFRAALEAQVGKVPQLCAPDGGFRAAYASCVSCITERNPYGDSTGLLSEFTQFIDYCGGQAATSSAIPSSSSSAVSSPSLATLSPASSSTAAASGSKATSTSSAFGTVPATSSNSIAASGASSAPPVTTSVAPPSIFTTSIITTSVVTKTQAGTTATYTDPGATVFESPSVATTTVQSIITSLTLCPSLTSDAAYTAPVALPTDYTWGCPPGLRCAPRPLGCNYNQFPAEAYYCAPDDCVPVRALPSSTPTTLPFPFIQGYLYLNPADFGLLIDQVFDVRSVVTTTHTFKSTAAASPPSHTTSSASSLHKVSAGVIAGSAVGGVAGLTLIIALLSFFLLRRRRRRKQAVEATAAAKNNEKAQLHSNDLKPFRNEIDAGIKRKPVPPREMAANEEPNRTVSEMPANEVVGSEMESSAGKSLGTSSAAAASSP